MIDLFIPRGLETKHMLSSQLPAWSLPEARFASMQVQWAKGLPAALSIGKSHN